MVKESMKNQRYVSYKEKEKEIKIQMRCFTKLSLLFF